MKNKCQAAGGVSQCTSPRCPEKGLQFSDDNNAMASFSKLSSMPKPSAKPYMKKWGDEDTVLFKTIHGSKLYNLDDEHSDEDYFIITPTPMTRLGDKIKHLGAKQKIDGNLDTLTADFKTFVQLSEKGVPQSLETMFSQKSESPYFEGYRANYFASDPRVVTRYLSTIHAFALPSEKETERRRMKYLRHALRLSTNLDELVHTGRFNPTLSDTDAARIKRYADYPQRRYLAELQSMNPFHLNWVDDLK